MSIELLDYQEEAINNIFGDEKTVGLFERGKRSAAVVLPTGGGKSFVAMRTIEEMMKKFPIEPTGEYPKAISEFGLSYFAPNTGILYQFRLHMAENMIYNHYLEEYKKTHSITQNSIRHDVENILKNMYPDKLKILDFDYAYSEVLKEKKYSTETEPQKIIEAIVKKNLKSLKPKDLEKVVSKSYPNMNFQCYQNLKNINLEEQNSMFYIFDEAHRGGAQTWIKQLKNIVEKEKDSYFLSITATPERNSDEESLIDTIAKYTGYDSNERTERRYMAKEYYLLNAIKDGRVINPKIVGFTCTLDESSEYLKVVKTLKKLESKDIKNGSKEYYQYEALRTLKEQMDEIIGKKGLNEEQWAIKKQELINEILNENGETKVNKNGKYIAFIPDSSKTELKTDEMKNDMTKKDISDLKSKKNIEEYIDELKEKLGEKIKIFKYHSSIKSKKLNDEALQQFGFLNSIEGGIKFIITNKKLNEGVHVEDVDGEIMLDRISSNKKNELSSRFLQQIGRCIRAILPNESQDKIKPPIIYDYANNFMRNFELLKLNEEMVLDYDQNSTNASAFFNLYNIFENGVKDKRIVKEDGNDYIEFLVEKNGWIRFQNSAQTKGEYKKVASKRYEILIETLKILEKATSGYKINLKELPHDIVINDDFFKKYGFSLDEENRIKGLLLDIKAITPNSKEYHLGDEMNKFKKVFYGIEYDASIKKVLSNPNIDFSELARLGVIYLSPAERLLKKYEELVDINGFIKPTLKLLNNVDNDKVDIEFLDKLVGLNVNTGTKYYLGKDEFGCFQPGTTDNNGNDIGGYDIYGYDKYGFNKKGIHKLTGQKYNERYFSQIISNDGTVSFKNIITGNETDIFGFDINDINPETGFDRGGILSTKKEFNKHYWHKYNPKINNFSRIFTDYNLDKDPPVDEYGATKVTKNSEIIYLSFRKDRESSDTGEYLDKDGLDIDRFDGRGFKRVLVKDKNGEETYKYFNRETSSEYDRFGIDFYGDIESNLKKCNNIFYIIIKNKDLLKKKKGEEKLLNVLKKNYEKNEMTIDDIIDKAFSMYRTIIINDENETELYWVKQIFESSMSEEYDECFEFIRKCSPKFEKQLIDIFEYRNLMNKIFEKKCGKLMQCIKAEFGTNASDWPIEIQKKVKKLVAKTQNSKQTIINNKEKNDVNYRDF